MTEPGLPSLPALAPWMSEQESEKAWMSVRDADLLELLLVAHAARSAARAKVLEWGAGRSTLWYSRALEQRNLLGSWVSLEHNREFFLSEVAPQLANHRSASYVLAENLGDGVRAPGLREEHREEAAATVCAVVFDAGELHPYDPGREHDRQADLDDYVGLPASLDTRFDFVLVDGRKRRRCMLEAGRLLGDTGIVVLHDAWRTYYHCAFEAYRFSCRVGDMLWVGAQHDPDLGAILPAHAFRDHADGD
jgi:predicted O-methyltransferase YrrM